MTQNDYIKAAEIFRHARELARSTASQRASQPSDAGYKVAIATYLQGELGMLEKLKHDFANLFAHENPGFNRELYLRSCNPQEET